MTGFLIGCIVGAWCVIALGVLAILLRPRTEIQGGRFDG